MPRKTYKFIITNEELIKQINPKNLKLMQQFLREKNIRSSDGTIKGYESDLNIFMVWNLQENNNKFFIEIKKLELAEFFNYCIEILKWNSARFERMRSCLSSFSNFIERFMDDIYPEFRNIVLKAVESMPKEPSREKTILSEEQVNNLLKYLIDNKKYQQACWLALAISSGARFSELLRFTIDIIDRNNLVFDGIFIETLKKVKTKGRTKSGKLLTKYIIKDIFLKYYDLWLPEREEIMKKNGKDHNSIFIKKDGSPAEEFTVRYWLSELEEFLKVPLYPHCLRHFTTTYLTRIGLSSQLIIELMGWQSADMFNTYNDLQATDRKWDELDKLKEHLNKSK